MTESTLYETIGRKQAELDALHGEYDRLLALLGQVLDGRVPTDAVRVDLHQRRWEVVAPLTSPRLSGVNGAHAQDELDEQYIPPIESL